MYNSVLRDPWKYETPEEEWNFLFNNKRVSIEALEAIELKQKGNGPIKELYNSENFTYGPCYDPGGVHVHIWKKDSLIKNMSSLIANVIRRSFTHDGMDDTGCPLKVIKTDIAKKIPMFKGLHRFLPAMVLLQKGSIKQVPVRHYPRIAGQAKYGLWNRLLGPLSDCFAYLWMKRKYINYRIIKTNND